MGRYGGPHFEKEGVVSIWVAIALFDAIPDDDFEENYGGENEEPFNAFSTDFGFGYYDGDFADTNAAEQGPVPVESLIGQCSFSSSYLKEALAEARRRGIAQSKVIFHLYDFEYQPAVTGVTRSPFFGVPGQFRLQP